MSKKLPTEPLGPPVVAVCADPHTDHDLLKAAARLSVDLDLPFLEKPPKASSKEFEMLLVATAGRVELRVLQGDAQMKGGRAVYADLSALDTTSNAGRSLKQPIAKALGLKKRPDPAIPGAPTVIDATAGWGEDAWLMAALGCRVLAVERNKIVATLLRDGLFRMGAAPGMADVLSRLNIVTADAKHLLRRVTRVEEEKADDLPPQMQGFLHPDIVYLDPMFPTPAFGKARKTAERKPMRVLRRLVGGDADAGELFDWAVRAARKRVVVKRPAKADPIAPKPTMKIVGKGFRFDVYVVGK